MAYLDDVLKKGICPKCNQPSDTIDEQYSYGVYAGVMCRPCAIKGFRDCCGHRPEGQGTPKQYEEETGERYWPEYEDEEGT